MKFPLIFLISIGFFLLVTSASGKYFKQFEEILRKKFFTSDNCVQFKQECQDLCLEQSGGVSVSQCWGNPLYCYCKASDGTVKFKFSFLKKSF